MEQFLKTKEGIINLRMVNEITKSYRRNDPFIIMKRTTADLPVVEILYDQEIKLKHDLKLIRQGLLAGDGLIELEYG